MGHNGPPPVEPLLAAPASPPPPPPKTEIEEKPNHCVSGGVAGTDLLESLWLMFFTGF